MMEAEINILPKNAYLLEYNMYLCTYEYVLIDVNVWPLPDEL